MNIYFYNVVDEYGCFSNFSRHGFECDGKYWPTSEHYFQAQKFIDEELKEMVRQAATPMIAANLGRNRSYPLRDDWEHIKDSVMREAVLSKFSSNSDIQKVLLGTGDSSIIEKTTEDYYWGCGRDGTGLNRLGSILMEVRSMLNE